MTSFPAYLLVIMIFLQNVHVFSLTSSGNMRCYSQTALSMVKKMDIRPTVDDVERISKGQAAKRRGTGSRAVPHRLNTAERKEWDLAKRRRYLQLRGTGWRKERGDSPLANIYRNYCDAVAVPCVSITRAIGIDAKVDRVTIDFSPLRTKEVQELAQACISHAKSYPSVIEIIDNSNGDSLGWANLDELLIDEPIWRIPVFSVVVGFDQRMDSKRYAQHIACSYAKGQPHLNDDSNDDKREAEEEDADDLGDDEEEDEEEGER